MCAIREYFAVREYSCAREQKEAAAILPVLEISQKKACMTHNTYDTSPDNTAPSPPESPEGCGLRITFPSKWSNDI